VKIRSGPAAVTGMLQTMPERQSLNEKSIREGSLERSDREPEDE